MIPAWENNTLKPIDKLEVHQRGLKHMAVSVFIMAGSETLIQRRSMIKYHTPGLWANACCTHPHWKEASEKCAVRRVKEELGVSNIDLKHQNQVVYKADVGNSLLEYEVVEIFLAKIEEKSLLKLNLNPLEVMDTRWVNIEKLQMEITHNSKIFTPWFKIYIKQHIKDILST